MSRLVFRNARLLDGDSDRPDPMTVVVNSDRFERVDGSPGTGFAPDDEVYDLGGATIMPGMIQGHFHATYPGFGPGSPPIGMEAPPAMQALRAANHLRLALHNGFTGAVSAGGPYAIDASCKAAIAEGLIEGPRFVPCSRDVSTTGHAQDWVQWHWGEIAGPGVNLADGADAFRRAVREEIKRGAEMIKIFATPGHGVPGSFHNNLEMSEAELAAAIETAHSRNIRVRAHIAGKEALLVSLRLGIDIVDHADGMDDECLDRILEKDVFVVPSLRLPYELSRIATGPMIDDLRKELEGMMKMVPLANKAGVRFVLGDDYGVQPLSHGRYGEELEFYTKVVGIPALDVIRWATKHGGEMCGGKEQGTIAKDKLADFIIVDGDPITNIALLADPGNFLAIGKGGKFVSSRLRRETQPTDVGPRVSAYEYTGG
jgi:imidazolonepropionase-like amidohydrolase